MDSLELDIYMADRSDQPVEGVAHLQCSDLIGGYQTRVCKTDGNGCMTLPEVRVDWGVFTASSPGFWATYIDQIEEDSSTVHVDKLPLLRELAWWHQCIGVQPGREERGKGIKIGVIDTNIRNISGPHRFPTAL